MQPQTLATLIDTHAAALGLFARSWCATPEDVVQVALAKLVTARPTPADPVAWLYRVVRNGAIDAGKAERRRQQREAAAARPERWFDAAGDAEDAESAVAALSGLPPECREVIVARLWGGQTLEAVAAAVGCSVSTAHRRFEAGVALLRERLTADPCHKGTP